MPNLAPERQAAHVDNVKREVAVLKRLRGTLNVVAFHAAYEDDVAIHIVMELCRGGELLHHVTSRPFYGERTVASFMRAVLRTVAQCHSHRILHRDVKPGGCGWGGWVGGWVGLGGSAGGPGGPPCPNAPPSSSPNHPKATLCC